MNTAIRSAVPLAPLTSFKVGGSADYFSEVTSTNELLTVLTNTDITPITTLGYGSNSLVSDKGIRGLTITTRGGECSIEGDRLVADGGVWWDELVQKACENELWGIELLSYIPGSFGASLAINIAAYGQTLGPLVAWIEYWDPETKQVKRLEKEQLSWGYKSSVFQSEALRNVVITRACLQLSKTPTTELVYQKALDVALELQLSPGSLQNRRSIIYEARKRAASLWEPNGEYPRTAGSFFKNPLVDPQTAHKIIAHDESGATLEQIQKMNSVHGGSATRVSAAHVMLACGFSRGQRWGNVKLNDQNLLKIEALDGATAQDIYTVMRHIQETCKEKCGVELEPEIRLLGDFN